MSWVLIKLIPDSIRGARDLTNTFKEIRKEWIISQVFFFSPIPHLGEHSSLPLARQHCLLSGKTDNETLTNSFEEGSLLLGYRAQGKRYSLLNFMCCDLHCNPKDCPFTIKYLLRCLVTPGYSVIHGLFFLLLNI